MGDWGSIVIYGIMLKAGFPVTIVTVAMAWNGTEVVSKSLPRVSGREIGDGFVYT